MGTLAALKSRIADELNRTDLTSQIAASILKAIEFYASDRLWFLEDRKTATATADNAYVSHPSGLRVIDAAFVTISGVEYPLCPRSNAWLEDRYGGYSDSNQPTDYAVVDDQIRLWPTPDDTYTLTFVGLCDLATLADGETNAWTSTAEDLIAARVCWSMQKRILRDYEAAAMAKEDEREALGRLRAETTRRLTTGRNTPSE